MDLDRGLRDRVAILRFVMIFGVIVLHTPAYVPMAEVGHGWFDTLKAYFQLAVFRASVPVLTVISGFLMFGARLDQAPARLFGKKARTILVPFLCFNLPLVPLAFAAQLFAGIDMSTRLWPFEPMTWLNATLGLTSAPINYPLHFLRDLFVLILLAPLFGWLLRHYAWSGLLLVGVVFFSNYDGILVLRDLMAVLFYVGGMAAVRSWNLRLLDPHALPCLLLFLLACAAIIQFEVANTTYLRLVAPFLLWPAASLLVNSRIGSWLVRMSKYSFFIFLAHSPVLLLTWIIYGRAGDVLPYPLYWFMAPVIVTIALVFLYQLAHATSRLFPVSIGATATKRAATAPAVTPHVPT